MVNIVCVGAGILMLLVSVPLIYGIFVPGVVLSSDSLSAEKWLLADGRMGRDLMYSGLAVIVAGLACAGAARSDPRLPCAAIDTAVAGAVLVAVAVRDFLFVASLRER